MFEVADQLHVDEVATSALLQWSDACGPELQWGQACGLRPELCATYAPLPVSEVGQLRPELQWSDACGLRPELHATCAPLPVNDLSQIRP